MTQASDLVAPSRVANTSVRSILVFDTLVRIFHWLLAAGFITAFGLANLADEHSSAFSTHMLIGMVLVFMVLLRVVWGFAGTRYARFGSFLFGPRETMSYLSSAVRGARGRDYVGHNPGSSWAILAMLLLFLGLGLTGLMNARGSEAAEEVHEVLAWTLAAVATLHVLGVSWHVLRRKDNIVASMINGRKVGDPAAAIARPRRWAGLAFVLLTGWWAFALYSNYDTTTRTLTVPIAGTVLQLGEQEEDEEREGARSQSRETEEDDD